MRKIKFRIWDEDGAELINQDDIYWIDFRNDCASVLDKYNYENNCQKEISINHIMQSTGFNDKNGVEIYEGDIIEYTDKTSTIRGQIIYGIYDEDWQTDLGFYIKWYNRKNLRNCFKVWQSRGIKVIGNIYTNSELLEKDKHTD